MNSARNLNRAWILHVIFLNIVGGSCHKYNFCRDKTLLLIVTTKVCLPRQNYVLATNVLSWQAYFCRDNRRVCRDKYMFVARKVLSGGDPNKNKRVTHVVLSPCGMYCQRTGDYWVIAGDYLVITGDYWLPSVFSYERCNDRTAMKAIKKSLRELTERENFGNWGERRKGY